MSLIKFSILFIILSMNIKKYDGFLGLNQEKIICTNGKKLSPIQIMEPTFNGCGPESWSDRFAKFFNDFPLIKPFSSCCDVHDLCYGGQTSGEINYFLNTREECDSELYTCMLKNIKNMHDESKELNYAYVYDIVAETIHKVVRTFGNLPFKLARIKYHCKNEF